MRNKNRFYENIISDLKSSDWNKILIFVLGKDSYLSLALLSIVLMQSIIPVTILWLGKNIIDTSLLSVNEGLGEKLKTTLVVYLILYGLINIVSNILGYLFQMVNSILGEVVTKKINLKILEKALNLDMSYFENPDYYDMLARARNEAHSQPAAIIGNILQILRSLISSISYIVVLIGFNWIIIIIVLFSTVPTILNQKYFSFKKYLLEIHQTKSNRIIEYIIRLCTTKEPVKEIKIYNLKNFLLSRYQLFVDEILATRRKHFIKKNVSGIGTSLISYISYFTIYCYAIYEIVNQHITIGSFVFLTGAFSSFQSSFTMIIASGNNIYEKKLFISNLFKFLELKPMYKTMCPVMIPTKLKHGIQFKNVSFKYPESDKYVFKDLNLNILPGERIVIIGNNGSGKSTFIKLLLRLYEPNEGSIMIDNIDVKNFEIEDYNSMFNVLFQDFYKYSFSVAENIGIGSISNLLNIDEIVGVAKKVNIHKTINGLPHGYQTILGRDVDDNTDLSIGEWQKIAIARALFRKSLITVLDEPTSYLDPISENKLLSERNLGGKNKIFILISHRLSAVLNADRVIFFDEGKILCSGKHKYLLKNNKFYATYYKSQASKYIMVDNNQSDTSIIN